MIDISRVKGMQDYLFDSAELYNYISQRFYKITSKYGYSLIQTPILEKEELFVRSLGEMSDVVSKEMYSFVDKGGERLVMRPEGTAPVVRSFIENGLYQNLPCKLAYFGPMFRYERPQKARTRQFYQMGLECFGGGFERDVEVIVLAESFLKNIEVSHFNLEINTLGDSESRNSYVAKLTQYFQKNESDLSEISKKRLLKNPLRILDSKEKEDFDIVQNAPKILDSLNHESTQIFENVLNILSKLGVNYTVNPGIVRGLDYYTHTVFEFTSNALGAQSAILAGGRYDNFVSLLGGPNVGGIGWATSFERLASIVSVEKEACFSVIVLSDDITQALEICEKLRSCDIKSDFIIGESFKKSMQKAIKSDPEVVIFLGEDERKSGSLTIKNMKDKQQIVVQKSDDWVSYITKLIPTEHLTRQI